MLWLIWIALMLLTPIVAGVFVWRETRTAAPDSPPGSPLDRQAP